eukprot:TRINITY_DN7387_c0_g1_i1.p1 TRINITY_DN7387_c0_g1~~TRINITY_DN7387_c0_g1_i1.p1  ORF type:complete len:126 (+),score=28.40 TRINITY_DN7387_c0_g1_i1:108-485(+)
MCIRDSLERLRRVLSAAVAATLMCFDCSFGVRATLGLPPDLDSLLFVGGCVGARDVLRAELKKTFVTQVDPGPPPTMWSWDECSFKGTFRFQQRDFKGLVRDLHCLLYTSPSPRDRTRSRMPSSA